MTTTTTAAHPYGRSYAGSAPENYERWFIPAIGSPFAHELVAAAQLRAGERVLDVACGTGIVARLAAERVAPNGTVSALDVNEGMLNVARSVTRSTAVPIHWYETPAESIPLPDDSFDVVLCQLGLMFMEDRGAAAREMRRVAAPGGRVLVSVAKPTDFFDVMERGFERHLPEGAPFVRLVFSMNDADALAELFREAGLRDVTVRTVSKEIKLPAPKDALWQYVHSTPLTGAASAADPEVLGALERQVVSEWQPWVRDGGLAYEQGVLVMTGRK
jgi:ubiquinone/menaquinone biosynthesis C-methylase UbiE